MRVDQQLGHGDGDDRSTPTPIEGAFDGLRVVLIDHGNGASYAVTEDGGLWAWGQNRNGQLGLGDLANRDRPTRADALEGESVVALSSGTAHTLALTESGRFFASGQNRQGQLGAPEGLDDDGRPLVRVAPPFEVTGLPDGVPVVAVSASTLTSYAVLADGRVFGWGEGRFGQLLQGARDGDGTFLPDRDAVLEPVALPDMPPNVVDVKGGARWAAELTADGDVWLWGPNDAGPTGGLDGDPAVQSPASFLPVKLGGLDAPFIVEIATGPNHVLARAENGTVFSFGANADGRLGYLTDGLTTEPAIVPLGEPLPPVLLRADAEGDGLADPTADLVLTFSEPVSAGDGLIRLVNRSDATDVIEIAAADTRRVTVNGETVTVDPPGFLRPGARYSVELDADAFRDAEGLSLGAPARPGWAPLDIRVDSDAIALIGTEADNRSSGTEADELILIGPGRGIFAGGGGADTFFFGATTENGVRGTVTIRDFDPLMDQLDFGGVGVESVRTTRRYTILTLEGDGDVVILSGVTDFDYLMFA